jgi:hypothetical protein
MKSRIKFGFKCSANLEYNQPDTGDAPEFWCLRRPIEYWCYCTPRSRIYFGRCKNHTFKRIGDPKDKYGYFHQITCEEATIAEVMET